MNAYHARRPSFFAVTTVLVRITLLLLASGAVRTAFAQDARLDITPANAALAGSTVTVKWSGPDSPGDYITLVRRGAGPSEYLSYRPTNDGRAPVNPVSIVMPAEPDGYEIRYVRGNPRSVLAAVPYEVKAAVASIEGPASVAPGARFEVTWSGPNNGGDWVTIVAAGAAPRAYASYVDARSGRADEKTGRSTATLLAPNVPGRYELRYVQQGTRVIGTRAIDVGAAPTGCASPVVITQTFDGMKASVASQYEALIRNSPSQAAALTAQRDRLLAEIDSLKQQNLGAACPTGANPAITQNTPPPQPGGTITSAVAPVPRTLTEPARGPVPSGGAATQPGVAQAPTGSGTGSSGATRAMPPINASGITPGVVADAPAPVFTAVAGAGPAQAPAAASPPAPQVGSTASTPGGGVTPGTAVPPLNAAGISPGTVATGPVTGALAAAPAPVATQSGVIPSGRYLITVSELICVSPTKDDDFGLDGRGDEIYAAAYVRRYDRTTGALAAFGSTRTRVYGDTASSDRIRAGTQSGGGGIKAGDHIPDGGRVQRLVPPLDDRFPWRVWEGELRSNIDALVISPSVWESDGRNDAQVGWVRQQGEISSTMFAHGDVAGRIADGTAFGPVVIGENALANTITSNLDELGNAAVAALISGSLMFPVPGLVYEATARRLDRPLGLRYFDRAAVGTDIVLPNTAIVLTREIIEAALNRPHIAAFPSGVPGELLQIPGPGYIILTFADQESKYGPGIYTMVLQVERVSSPP